MPVKRDVPESRELSAWYGTVSELLSLVKSVEDMYADERERGAAEIADSAEWRRTSYQWDWQSNATAYEPNDVQTSGPLDEVLIHVSPARVRLLLYRYPNWSSAADERVDLWFGNRLGQRVTVRGSDPVRVRVMADVIAEHASRNNPRWAFLLTLKGFLLAYAGVVAAVYLLALGVLRHLGTRVPAVLAVGPATVAGSAVVFMLISPRLLPRFELLGEGASPRAKRVLGWLGTLAAGAIAGAIVSFALG